MAKSKKRPPESFSFVLRGDRDLPEGEQSRFVLRPMTIDEQAAYLDASRDDADGGSRLWRAAVAIVPQHIVSVENFPAGEPREWPKGHAERLEYLAELGVSACYEIGTEVFNRSYLEDAAKN